VLEHVIGELGRLTEEQQALMAQKAREREEEARRLKEKSERSKKQPKAKAAASTGKVEAGKKHLEKAVRVVARVRCVRSRVCGGRVRCRLTRARACGCNSWTRSRRCSWCSGRG
jgi:ElaB/YqjD/DUF883 family membrane-anchored ribosome-binding protein